MPLLALLRGYRSSSRRASRPALRLSCLFSLPAFPKYHPPEKTLSSLHFKFLLLFQTWLMCCRWKTGKRDEGVFGSIPSLSHLTSQTQKNCSTALTERVKLWCFFQFAPLSDSLTFLSWLREYRDCSSVLLLLQIPAHGG